MLDAYHFYQDKLFKKINTADQLILVLGNKLNTFISVFFNLHQLLIIIYINICKSIMI